ncbi:helix-turn-helix domain-containing protein [Weissella confusa]|uniref:helix-turn-helix domain-containing protein n=1 Tax=Weissella confusa TaxID=1583 RepID=UPI003A4D81A0
MIVFKLGDILTQLSLSQNSFAKLSNIRPNTINDIVNNRTKRIELQTLQRILNVIYPYGFGLSDLMEYIND